ncbi:3-isopropylmalate dehydrogenase [Marinoscillum pacificum]|uniref:3-isopropylmalate dehydrogenase n=1 Tax=Marinoscillum pacificum TaxID=392723 RepID=UPI002157729A|nr:3-isopropylmalate dehydrogenase [Marinoscillum pacificum]
MANKNIVILGGDGIGPEVTAWGNDVLKNIADAFGHTFSFQNHLIGHAAIEATGNPLPDETLDACKAADAILLGAVGHPMYDNDPSKKVRPEQGLLKIRKSLGLYTNIRPIQIFDELAHASSIKPEILMGSDILFFRELTGGIYFGEPRERQEDGEVAVDTMRYSKMEVRRIAEKAFDAAMTRRKILHSIDKANVLESSRLWRETVNEVAKDYPEVKLVHMFIDNAAMQLIKDPKQFDVVVTGNMFGDILTDEASQIAGSLGMLASASVGDSVGIYEPIHGSAPDIAGQNKANPLATILSTALLLDISFGMKEESQAVIDAVDAVLKDGFRTADIAESTTPKDKILGTDAIGQQVVDRIKAAVAS